MAAGNQTWFANMRVSRSHHDTNDLVQNYVFSFQCTSARSLRTLSQSVIPHRAKHHIRHIFIHSPNILGNKNIDPDDSGGNPIASGIWWHMIVYDYITQLYPYIAVGEIILMISLGTLCCSTKSATAEIAFGGLTAIFSKLRGCVGNLCFPMRIRWDMLGMQWPIRVLHGRFVVKHYHHVILIVGFREVCYGLFVFFLREGSHETEKPGPRSVVTMVWWCCDPTWYVLT